MKKHSERILTRILAMNNANPRLPPDFDRLARHARHCSRYLSRLLDIEPELLDWLHQHYLTPCDRKVIKSWADTLPADNEQQLSRALRILRKRVMLHVLTRDLNGLSDLDEVMRSMTALAEIAVRKSQALVMQSMVEQFGQPVGAESGTRQELLVIGMGKLGGGELNVSSDIDLIFVYPEDGDTDGTRSLSNHEFFNRMGRRLIALINDLTADGYVFRVDMRLRPYGDSGPLTMSFAALEEYLVAQGREWERYAWIKARVIAPENCTHTTELEKLAQPFVFRKYLDFGSFDSMRKLHAQIRSEVARRGLQQNIKLGPGGIREIEFIAQVFQLIRGGRDAGLRIRPTRKVLQQLAQDGELGVEVVARLDDSYVFLRNLEHRLQYLDDRQTQELPENPEQQALVAEAMNFADYGALLAALAPLREFVSRQFETVFGEKQESTGQSWWREDATKEEFSGALATLGFRDDGSLAENLLQFRTGSRYRQLPEASCQRLDLLLPRLAELCAETSNREDALRRTLAMLDAIARRSSYLAFLAEYPQALPRLVHLLAASAWAGDYLTQHPILLDELLDTRELYVAPDWKALDMQLATRLEAHVGDTEREMDSLRQFQQAQTFQLLAIDLHGQLPLEKLSDHLSDLADLVLRHVLRLCWRDARKKHREDPQFAVIAYGKLGGRELGYASDLDLVFLYDDEHPEAGEIYARLAQRINTMLSSYTSSGRLYEVDLRLRPNGDSGLLVSSIAAFEEYQRQHAWVWEHQALTRARFCAGNEAVGAQFARIRDDVLRMPRDIPKLRQDVIEMRQKMHDGHPDKTGLFDIKHGRGGMVDIEFMVQFIVLAHAATHPELTANRGNLALLDIASKLNLIDGEIAGEVRGLYRELRRIQHQMRLNNQTPCLIEPGILDTTAALRLWQSLFMPG
ncbi:MAG: bifunctional [glutamate--ammonia ligase]-adenylyl-L-tyrosine phosphorylase/[glutamate--ammonia-ligase] adenylyltransferase [Nitrosomonadales bacterium]|nr:bifunctional [glutamate--ammonia ligase]-adenylyl-L-tyrosine phosphorylase/[glutamate--ammonia-ligase] adenylyltransferase [Nitrosomonadales bacterium]